MINSFENNYKKNRMAFREYNCHIDICLPEWEKLKARAVVMADNKYAYHTSDGNLSREIIIKRTVTNTRGFFKDINSPLLVENEMNSYHFEYLMDNVRSSEDYGDDNHIYMYYDSMDLLCLFLQVVDITSYLSSGKFMIITDLDKYPYGAGSKHETNDISTTPKPIRIEEIQRIYVNLVADTCSGNFFSTGILDFTPDVLTIFDVGLADFYFLYQNLLHNETVEGAVTKIINNNSARIHHIIQALFSSVSGIHTSKINVPAMSVFFETLKGLFPLRYRPAPLEWLKSFFLAYNMAMGRSFKSRIVPAIVFQTDGHVCVQAEYLAWLHKNTMNMFRGMKYVKIFSVFRRPSISRASSISGGVISVVRAVARGMAGWNYLVGLWWPFNLWFDKTGNITRALYVKKDDPFIADRGIVRFEDIKLYPRATLMALCDFLDIPFAEEMLTITANGTQVSTSMDGKTKIKGFDSSPVFKLHEDVCSAFDHHRIEILVGDDALPWGYKSMFKEDRSYSEDEILNLFKKPFKCEEFLYTKQQIDSIGKTREELYKKIHDKIATTPGISKERENLAPVPWIRPNPELLEGRLYD